MQKLEKIDYISKIMKINIGKIINKNPDKIIEKMFYKRIIICFKTINKKIEMHLQIKQKADNNIKNQINIIEINQVVDSGIKIIKNNNQWKKEELIIINKEVNDIKIINSINITKNNI